MLETHTHTQTNPLPNVIAPIFSVYNFQLIRKRTFPLFVSVNKTNQTPELFSWAGNSMCVRSALIKKINPTSKQRTHSESKWKIWFEWFVWLFLFILFFLLKFFLRYFFFDAKQMSNAENRNTHKHHSTFVCYISCSIRSKWNNL